MGRYNFLSALLLGLLLLFAASSCKKEKSNPFDDKAKQDYEAVILLQQESVNVLAGFKTTMDSAAAVQALAQWLRDTSLVESVVVSSQGLSVKYTSGIWGGILLDPERYDEPSGMDKFLKNNSAISTTGDLKNLPTSKKANFMAASFNEFANVNMRQNNRWSNSFNTLGYGYALSLGAIVGLNYLADVREMGSVLCLDSHGYAWPDHNQVSEVYFITQEKVNLTSTEKYYQDIIDHKILILSSNPTDAIYSISPGFITKYNDFSKDTVLFFGGFCYSYLGNWPSLVDACASGTYFGFDWVVMSDKCADWAIDLVDHLADQNEQTPWTVEKWMTSSTIAKQYIDAGDNKTVHILYNGNGALTLWKPVNQGNGTIISTASDGAPVTIPGYTCTDYILKCNLTGQLPSNLGYDWEFGDGSSSYYTVNDNLCLYHHWPNAQSYTVRVTVTDINTNATICELTKVVNFVDPDYLPQLTAWKSLDVDFGPTESIHLTNGTTMYVGYFYFQSHAYSTPLTWTDSSFYARNFFDNDQEIITMEGNVSSDGRILKHALFTKTKSLEGFLQYELYLEVTNLPILSKDTLNCIALFWYDKYGSINQSYATRVEFRNWDPPTSSWITISNIDWPTTYLSIMFTNDLFKSKGD